MKKGLLYTLLAVAFAYAQVSTVEAVVPTIAAPPDLNIGDAEDGSASNNFVYPDAFDLRGLFIADDTEDSSSLKWSIYDPSGELTFNGVTSLASPADGNDPPGAKQIQLSNADQDTGAVAEDGDPFTVTVRDELTSPAPSSGGMPYAAPATAVVSRTVTIYGSDSTSAAAKTFLVVTSDDTLDSFTPSSVQPGPEFDEDYDTDGALGWTGFNPFGLDGTTGLNLIASPDGGLCGNVGAVGAFAAAWVSPEDVVTLKANSIYRFRAALATDQTAVNAIPFMSLLYDNFDAGTGFINYGGEMFLIDVAGGSAGIGRAQGINTQDMFFGPNATLTAQWNAGIGDPANDAVTDMRLTFRILDTNLALLADDDSGTICMASADVDSFLIADFDKSSVFNAPLDGSQMDIQNPGFADASSVSASSVSGGTAVIDLIAPTTGNIDGLFLRPNAASVSPDTLPPLGLENPLKFDPVPWQQDTLYCLEVDMTSGTDPVTILTLTWSAPTFELISTHFSTRAPVGGLLDRAASPDGSVQTWTSYFYSHNPSDAENEGSLPDADRFKALLQVFNQAGLPGFEDLGDDALTISRFEISEVTNYDPALDID